MKNIIYLFTLCSILILLGGTKLYAQKFEPRPNKSIQQATLPKTVEREGPSNTSFEFAQQIKSDYDFGLEEDVLNIYWKIFRDKNIKAATYYYMANRYDLRWSKADCGYSFHIDYLPIGASGKQEAIITAELHPNLSRKDIEIAKGLLAIDIQNHAAEKRYGVKHLLSAPLASPPTVTFDGLGVFGVNGQEINVRAPSDFLEPIIISWRMTNVEDLLTALFNNVGLVGTITFVPDGDMASIQIPVTLKIDDHHTFGKFELGSNWRRSGWKNPTDFPVKLKNIHLLRMTGTGTSKKAKIYTWKLNDAVIPEKATANINGSQIPAWIDNDPTVKRMWIEYAVLPCKRCKEKVLKCIRGGGHTTPVKKIEFTVMNVLQYTKAEMLRIKVRSTQASPNGNKRQLNPITITKDGSTIPGGELFVPEGKSIDFEYKIAVYMDDGTKYESFNWVKCKEEEVVLGSRQVKEQIPHFNK